MVNKENKLNGTGKAIAAIGVVLAIAFVGGLRVFGADLGMPQSMGGIISFGGFMVLFVGGFLIAKAIGSETTRDDS